VQPEATQEVEHRLLSLAIPPVYHEDVLRFGHHHVDCRLSHPGRWQQLRFHPGKHFAESELQVLAHGVHVAQSVQCVADVEFEEELLAVVYSTAASKELLGSGMLEELADCQGARDAQSSRAA
jgi:hypothetical protein